MKKITLYASSAFLLIGLLTFCLWPRLSGFFKKAVYIALVGDMSPGNEPGEEMRNGVNLYLDKINRMGGVNQREIKLLVLNDKNDRKQAIKIASRIAESKDILMVLGHDWSSASIPAGRVYKKYGVPALSASSMDLEVTRQNDWYFSRINDTAFLGDYLANYIQKALKQKSAIIIAEDAGFSKSIADSFEKTARKLGIKIKRRWNYSADSGRLKEELAILSELRSVQDPGIICLTGFPVNNARIITVLRRSGKKYSIIIVDPFLPDSFTILHECPEEQAKPGYFSNGVYAIGLFIGDIANEKADIFRKEYFERYGKEPGWYGAYYYDAVAVAIEAMRRAEIQGKGHIRRDRQEIKKTLKSMCSPDTGIKGLQGYIYFDEKGVSTAPPPMGFYLDQKLLPAFTQYHLSREGSSEDDVLKKVLSGDSIFVGNRVMHKTRVVYAGIDINEISGLDQKKSTYYADFYLRLRYEGDFDDVSDIVFPNALKPLKLDHPITRKKEGDITTLTYHIKGDFKIDFDIKDYPFDRQALNLEFRHAKLTRDRLIYIANSFGMPDPGNKHSEKAINLKEWHIRGSSFKENIINNVSSMDASGIFDSQNTTIYSQCSAGIIISKKLADVIPKTFLPIIIFLAILYLIYFVGVDNFLVRMIIPLSVLIATAFYHIRLLLHLTVEYMTALEYAYFTIYILVILSLIIVLLINYFHNQKDAKKIMIISYAGRITHPLISLILFSWYLWLIAD